MIARDELVRAELARRAAWTTAREVGETTGLSNGATYAVLARLEASGRIESSAASHRQVARGRNPRLYRLCATATSGTTR